MPQSKALSDEQLVASFQESGEAGPVEELLRRYLPRVNALAYQMVLDESIADDLTQEVFLRALRSLKAFRLRSRFGTWLYRVALNTAYSHLRRQGNSPVRYQASPPERPADEATPDGPVLRAELDGEIRRALADLSPRLRSALVLTSLHDFSVKQAARVEGCTVATMYWRIHQARKQLRRRLERYLAP